MDLSKIKSSYQQTQNVQEDSQGYSTPSVKGKEFKIGEHAYTSMQPCMMSPNDRRRSEKHIVHHYVPYEILNEIENGTMSSNYLLILECIIFSMNPI